MTGTPVSHNHSCRLHTLHNKAGHRKKRKENRKTTHHTPVGQHITTALTKDHRKNPTKNKNTHWRTSPKNLATQNKRGTTT
jgi:hypothetical protein